MVEGTLFPKVNVKTGLLIGVVVVPGVIVEGDGPGVVVGSSTEA
jgi:hypothetical protein